MAQNTYTLLYFPPPNSKQKPTFEQKDTNRIRSKNKKKRGEEEEKKGKEKWKKER